MGLEDLFRLESDTYSRSLAFARADTRSSAVLEVIELALDVMLSSASLSQHSDDGHTVAAIAARIFNTTAACLREALSGYVQTSLGLMRDLVETQTLLDYFSHEPSMIARWREVDEKARAKEFAPARMRTALDERDGFTERKREKDYRRFCEYGTHLTYNGLRLLAEPDGTVTPGPRYREHDLRNCLWELGRRAAFCAATLLELLPNRVPDEHDEAVRLADCVTALRRRSDEIYGLS